MHRNKGYFAARRTKQNEVKTATGLANNKPNSLRTLKHSAQNKLIRQASLTKHNAFYKNGVHDRRGRYGRWYGHRWFGAAFWPYWFGDYFSFVIWPYDYYDSFWDYGPDAIFGSAFWPYGEYAYGRYGRRGAGDASGIAAGQANFPAADAVLQSCGGFAPGVGDLPLQQFEKIAVSDDQRATLNDLKAAVSRASAILQRGCPSQAPLTPAARLDAMELRLKAILDANDAVRDPLVRFYGSLDANQKEKIDASAQARPKRRRRDADIRDVCDGQAGFTDVSADSIAKTVALSDDQQRKLEAMKKASNQASNHLKETCPSGIPDTIEGRIEAAQRRIEAMIEAVNTIRPAVKDFYASLTDEQKASLNINAAQELGSRG
jgi:hypothetical protein